MTMKHQHDLFSLRFQPFYMRHNQIKSYFINFYYQKKSGDFFIDLRLVGTVKKNQLMTYCRGEKI